MKKNVILVFGAPDVTGQTEKTKSKPLLVRPSEPRYTSTNSDYIFLLANINKLH